MQLMSVDCLTKTNLEEFKELGFTGPFQLIEPEAVQSITKELASEKAKFFFLNRVLSRVTLLNQHLIEARWGKGKWHKGIHAISPKICQFASKPEILDRITPIIGEDIILWGSLMLTIRPDDKPSWHVDAECREWDLFESANVWLAFL